MTTAGRFGRRPPEPSKPAIELAHILTSAVPPHPASTDYLASLRDWQVLGNDVAGDCVAVTWANIRRLVTATLSTASYPSLAEVWTFYETQNPAFNPASKTEGPGSFADDGMLIQAALSDLVYNGGPDGVRAVAFARVNHADPAEVKAAIALFGSVWTGLNVLAANDAQFAAGQPWSYVPGSPLAGRHSVVTAGYGRPGPGPLGGDERFITWGQETSFTDDFWSHQVEEAWVVVWPEQLHSREFLAGVSLSALAADYQRLTGRVLEIPGEPRPGFVQEIAQLVQRVEAAGEQGLSEIGDFLRRHGL
jgi:hypothetical protein